MKKWHILRWNNDHIINTNNSRRNLAAVGSNRPMSHTTAAERAAKRKQRLAERGLVETKILIHKNRLRWLEQIKPDLVKP